MSADRNYNDFPTCTLTDGQEIYRIHRHRARSDGTGWRHFSRTLLERFDVDPEGTLYSAQHPLGALLEKARGLTLLSSDWRRAHRVTTVTIRGELRVADTTDPTAYSFGITNTVACGANYGDSQNLARALADHGFDGIRYLARHDVAAGERSVALFGTALVHEVLDKSDAHTTVIPASVLNAARRYGIRLAEDLPARGGTARDASSAYG